MVYCLLMTNMHPIPTDADLVKEIRDRWSPVIFSSREPDEATIHALFEAARFAPSSYNEQPWRFVYALKGDGTTRQDLEALLMDGNAWAKGSGMLMISFAKKTLTKGGKPNRVALHDVGAANLAITLQATKMGLITHQMGGFYDDKACAAVGASDDFLPSSMMVIGYPGDAAAAPEDLRKRQESARTRNDGASFAFRGQFV